VARWLRQHELRVCLLSRGYGSIDGAPNDEALVLEQLCPDVPHLQGADRVALARVAHEELDSQILLLDDAFQHRRLHRDLDIVLIDATNPWGYGRMLPRGLLREPRSALRRAHVIVLTRTDAVSPETRDRIRHEIQQAAPALPVLEVAFAPETLISASSQSQRLESLTGQRVAAFCGLGNPAAFRQTVEQCGAEIIAFREFPDHHPYTRDDVDSLRRWADEAHVPMVVTSQKDLVKLGLDRLGPPLWAVQIESRFITDPAPLDRLLRKAAGLDACPPAS
jgi:tetraacyldisaccharide 4'-kinase